MTVAPTDVPTLALWHRAHSISGNDGDVVTTWSDLSGSGFHATGGDPDLKKAANGINGKSVLRFNGVDDLLQYTGSGLDLFRNRAGMTVFLVIKATNDTQNASPFAFTTDVADTGRAAFIISNTTSTRMDIRGRRLDADSGVNITSSGALGTAAKIITGFWDYTNTIQRLFENGTQTATDNAFQTSGSTQNTASNEGGMGILGPYLGDIAEVIAYTSALSTLNRQRIEWYLAEDYAIAGPSDPDAGAGNARRQVISAYMR